MVRAGLEDKGQKVSKQDITVEQKVSGALLASRDDNCLRGGSEDENHSSFKSILVLLFVKKIYLIKL